MVESKRKITLRNIPGTIWARKFWLLMWKNFRIQLRHKVQTVVEVLIPAVFMLAYVYLRVIMPVENIPEPTVFTPFDVKSVPAVIKTTTNKIFYTPRSPYWNQVMGSVQDEYFTARKLKYSFEAFSSEAEMVEAYHNSMNGSEVATFSLEGPKVTSPVLAGIVFPSVNQTDKISNIEYTLRFPAYQRTEYHIFLERLLLKPSWFTDTLYPIYILPGPRSIRSDGGLPGYQAEGFLYLQNAIERSIINTFLTEPQKQEYKKYNVQMQRFPYPAYTKDEFTYALQVWFCFFLVFAFIYPAMNITKLIVHEKESRLKEYMKIMGLPNWLHWTAWFIKAFTFLALSSLVLLFLFKIKFTGERSILTETSSFVILAVLLCHSTTLIGYSFLMSTLFATANTAATAAGFIWVLNYIPFGFLFPRYNMMTRMWKYVSCFMLGNIPLSYACYIFAMFENDSTGVSWENIREGVSPDDSFSVFDCMVMMLVNAGVSMAAGFYIELVWPGKYGVPLPWYFPFTTWYWTNGIQEESSYGVKNGVSHRTEFFEPAPVHLNAGIDIRGLTKVFGKNVAVQNLDLVFYENQVTALLGHNGAGKTTTMSMLTGLVTPSSGTAVVNGYDICKDMNGVRASIGLCPQYNVLFDELTVEEHIRFFSLLKGYNASEAAQEANRMIDILGFESKRHAEAHTLSGGMKRKLSIGIAFCAGSKAVLLDEPTSGMDPGARRSTWDLIQSEKYGRTVILSTHFMEEADLLGDRIAIMAEGRVKCLGRSLFLKKKYGGFHHLIIVKKPGCIPSKITSFLKNNISSIQMKDDLGMELSYFLPDERSSEFPTLFEELDLQKDQLGISSFGVGNTSMEEVFMRVIKLSEKEVNTKDRRQSSVRSISTIEARIDLEVESPETPMLRKDLEVDGPRYEGLELTLHQLKAVLTKKMLFILRNRGLAALQIAIPIVILGSAMICFQSLPGLNTPDPFSVSIEKYEKMGRTITLTNCLSNHKFCDGYKKHLSSKYLMENHGNGSLSTIYLEKATENLRRTISKYMVGLEQSTKNTSRGELVELTAFFNNNPFHNPPLALNLVSNGFLQTFGIKKKISVVNHPFDYNEADRVKQSGDVFTLGFFAGWTIEFVLGVMGSAFSIFLIYERVIGAKHLQFVAGLSAPIYWAGSVLVDLLNYMIPTLLMLVVLVVLNIDQFHHFQVSMWFLILCFAHAWSMVGMMAISSFVFTIPSSGFARMTLLNSGTGLATVMLVINLETPEIGLMEVAELLHNIFIFIPNYALGMGVVQIAIHHDMREMCGQFDLSSMCSLDRNFICCRKYQEHFYSWQEAGIGKNLLSLFSFGIVCFIWLSLIEGNVISKIKAHFGKSKSGDGSNVDHDYVSCDSDEHFDEDVGREAERINSQSLTNLFKTDHLVIRNLVKVYNGKMKAVKQLTLGVPKGETFGLLGVNGAGKTTTFKMITGDIPITSGEVFLCKNSVRGNLAEVYKNLGYCPQFDALIDQLTGRETIRMFANLKGIKETHVDRIVDNLAENLLFTKHIDKKVGTYSGGNKRKLSTAVAMLGNPPVVFLDEPTTGLDPVARRHVWNVINRLRESGTSVVITSHCMEECEALCSRLAIMVDGKFRCLGSPQHLKNKFGEGYSIVAQLNYCRKTPIKLDNPSECLEKLQQWEMELRGLKNFIKQNFPDCQLKDSHPGFVQYYVPGNNTKWSKLFAVMEKAKEEFNLDTYSVGQTSLEQVFFNFTAEQKSYEE